MRSTRSKTTRRSSTSTKTRKYQRYTTAQLCSIATQLQKTYSTVAKMPVWKKVKGTTTTKYCAKIVRELRAVVKALRKNTVVSIDAKIKTLKTQVAKRIGVAVKSSRATSSAIKRLVAKRRKFINCKKLTTFVKLCSGLKLSSYKNPSYKGYSKTGSSKGYTRKTTTARRKTTRGTTKSVTTKYKYQTKALKKEIQKLKQSNSFMKGQVVKFRKQVAKLRRTYGTTSTKRPQWKIVKSKRATQDVSNIVRLSNALSNAFLGKQHRKAG
jgi:hypothetical protein